MGKNGATVVMGKLPPQDISIEKAVLGAIMLDKGAFAEANTHIHAQVFYKPSHALIYKAMVSLFDKNEKIDILTVVNECRALGYLEEVGGPYQITLLTNDVVSSANIENHCRILLEFYLKRQGVEIANKLLIESFDETIDVFDSFNNADNSIINAQEGALKGVVKDMSYFAGKVYEEYETVKATGVLGIETGIAGFDRLMCGLVAPDLLIVAGRPGAGKTAWALSVTKNITVDRDMPGAWFSYEMSGVQLTRRIVSQMANARHSDIRNGKLYHDREIAFINAVDRGGKLKLYIEDDPTINIRDLRTRATILKRKHGIKYIIVDYLQLMPALEVKGKSREQVVSEISRGLKSLAKELDIPVIALAQLSRKVEERPDKMPQLADLRESGSIEQDADGVMFLMRPEYYGMTENTITISGKEYSPRNLCIGITGKNRHGETCNFPMYFDGPIMQIKTHPEDEYVPQLQISSNGLRPIQSYDNVVVHRQLPPEKDDMPF